jgi:hypothetical protein
MKQFLVKKMAIFIYHPNLIASMKKAIVLLTVVILILVSGCAKQQSMQPSETFQVEYYGAKASSGGVRILNITYAVEDGFIKDCEGIYSYPPDAEQRADGHYENNVEQCDVVKLRAGNYNAPIHLVTNLPPGGEMRGNGSGYMSNWEWEIIN